ncbi:MAG: hypothetical protein ABR497_02535 [Kiritimatiellia bacterium]|nr:hypothetical protein [Lentisphaerota bacterium]
MIVFTPGSRLTRLSCYHDPEAGIGRDAVAVETEIGYNTIQYCAAWANRTLYGGGGALNLFSPDRDQIRNSLAFLNAGFGIRMHQPADHLFAACRFGCG